MKIKAIIAMLFLAGCVSQTLKSYVGKDITEPMMDYGAPVNVIDLPNGQRAYQWSSGGSVVYHGISSTQGGYSGTTALNGNIATTNGSVGSTSFIAPSVIDDSTCYYTLIADKNEKSWTVVGYRIPKCT